jgi:hypothetical protein
MPRETDNATVYNSMNSLCYSKGNSLDKANNINILHFIPTAIAP